MYKAMKAKISLMQVCEAQGEKLSNTRDFADLCKDLTTMSQESMHVFTCDQKNRVIERHMVSLGTLTATLIHPREILRPAILQAAASIVLVHNHPSGDTTPSEDDKRMTARISEACDIMGIRLLDHIIVGREGYYSFVDNGGI